MASSLIEKEKTPALEKVKTMMSLIAPMLLLVTFSTGQWTRWGWVTKQDYENDVTKYALISEYRAHVISSTNEFAAQEARNKEISGGLNEIKALLKVVPQLKALIRNRCNGVRELQDTIDALKREYRTLTGTEYQEPACNSPELLR